MKSLLFAAALLVAGGTGLYAKDGAGEAIIDFNGTSGRQISVPCGAVGTWTVTYTVPESGMAVGGGIKIFRVPNKYWLGQCKQTEDPKAPDYFTAKRSDGGPIEISYLGRFYKDHREAEVVIEDKPMAAGSKIILTFGDRSGGSIGAVVPFSWQPLCVFEVESDIDGDGSYARTADPLVIVPRAGPVSKFVVDLPLVAKVGETVRLRVRPEDKGSNVDYHYKGEAAVTCTDPKAEFLPEIIFIGEAEPGIAETEITFSTPGIHYVTVKSAGSEVSGSSNPVKVVNEEPEHRIYWGDLHCHTEESDGTGSLEFNYTYARDVACMDFIGVTDHLVWDNEGKPAISCDGPIKRTMQEWSDRQGKVAREFHVPGKFVTFLGYEWSGDRSVGGDHNVYYLDDTARVGCFPDLNKEYADLRSRGDRAAIIIPHVGGRVSDPKWYDPHVEPQLEINSMHGHFEWFAQDYLQKGYKVGLNGGSDGHFGLPGNDLWPNHGRLGLARRDVSVPQGTACIYAPNLSRKSIIDALYSRRTYATTCVKMLLEVTMDGRPMGSEYSSNQPPKMHILAAGTGKIGRIEIIRNTERIFNRTVDSKVVELDFTDDEPAQGEAYYYVRVSQQDGEIAWSSPIFFIYTGPEVQPTRKTVPWNYESEEDELGDPVDKDYLPELLDHLSWRAPGRFYDLKQVRMVHSPRGDYALFYGRDKSNGGGKIHIRWYVGFDSFRLHVARGWRDFGSEEE